MQFIGHLNDSLDNLEIYHLLEDEMAKYKTLNHKNIRWDKVYEYSLGILQEHSMDVRICNYFVLSCIALNNEESFKTLWRLFEFLADILQNSSQKTGNADSFNAQSKKLKNIIEHFIMEANRLNFSYSSQTAKDLNHIFGILGEILEYDFKEIQTRQEAQKKEIVSPTSNVKQTQLHTQNLDVASLNDREHRIFFNNLAFELLENNQNNINAYAIFIEAMWGKIRTLPAHREHITEIKYPDKNLIQILLQDKPSELEHIKCFMSNLTLNPFWIEGLKFFCDFLYRHKKINASKLLNTLTREFLTQFEEISHLKFRNGESMCPTQILNYFFQQDTDSDYIKPATEKNKQNKNIGDILLNINAQNNNSLAAHINALIEMAKLFEEKNMQNNAKTLYVQLKDLMEKTPLKDYLLEDYSKIKTKSEKI